jgi:hypothetical protein
MKDAGEFSCTIGNEKCSAPLIVEEPKVNFVAKLPATTTGTVGQDVRCQFDQPFIMATIQKARSFNIYIFRTKMV